MAPYKYEALRLQHGKYQNGGANPSAVQKGGKGTESRHKTVSSLSGRYNKNSFMKTSAKTLYYKGDKLSD
jgi:hypothetical protein